MLSLERYIFYEALSDIAFEALNSEKLNLVHGLILLLSTKIATEKSKWVG